MRHLILALMIALLPLRGWVGDVMATDMASAKAAHLQGATEIVAVHAHGEGDSDHFYPSSTEQAALQPAPDCVGHGAGESSPMADGHCESCPACQACNTVALSPLSANTAAIYIPPALPHSPAAQFDSAVSALGQKPPIS